jgi:hypothetical protein
MMLHKKHIKAFVLTVLFFGCIGISNVKAQEANYKAYSLFVYNFIKYIEWPPESSPQFVIGVMGNSPIVSELKSLAAAKKAKGKSIVIKIINSPAEAANCNLLYVPDSKSKYLKDYLAVINNKSILVVSEREGMAKKGAGINFVLDENENLKFEVSKATLAFHSLKIPTVLLNLGYVVD